MRLRALKEMGIKEVDISIVSADTEAKKIKYALSDNDRAGEYDEQQLAELVYPHIEEINLEEYKVDLGEAATLADVIEDYGPDLSDGTEDDVPEIDDTPAITQPGQLFTLGNHRLLCGDATKKEDVERLMGGEKADMVFTDPPYGYNKGISNDEAIDVAIPVYQATMRLAVISENAWAIVDTPKKYISEFIRASESVGWITREPILHMYRNSMANGPYGTNIFELSFVYSKGKPKINHRHLNAVDVARKAGSDNEHPTQKFVSSYEHFMKLFASDDALIIDPFLGSGTTLIAAEKLNRICYGMEIDPKYCDVIIKRYCDYTGADESAVRATVN